MTRLNGTKTLALFLACGLFAAFAHATDPANGPAPAAKPRAADASEEAAYEPAKRCEILQFAPADAWLIAYTAKGEDAFRHPVIEQLTGGREQSSILARTLAATFDGPTMLTVRGTPMNPFSWRITLAARTSLDRSALFGRLQASLLPAWNRSPVAEQIGRLQFAEDSEHGYLTLSGPLPMTLTVIMRNGVMLGFSGPESVDDWVNEMDTATAFVDTDEFQRLNANRDGPLGTLVYANLRGLVPLFAPQLNRAIPKLYQALQLDTIQCAAVIGSGSLRPGPLRLAVGVSEINPGLVRLLASAPSAVTLARAFPADATFFFQSSYKRASDVMDDLMAFAGSIDQVIVDEYVQERAEFKREIGLEPHSEILANFVGGWAFGARVEHDGVRDKLLALRIGSLEKLKAHLRILRLKFQLETKTTLYRNITIKRAERSLGRISYAVVAGLLLASEEEQTMLRAIDAVLDGTGLDHASGFQAIRTRFGSKASKFLYFNLAELASRSLESGEDAPIPGLDKIAESGTTVGLAVVPHDRMIAFELLSSDDKSEAFTSVIFGSIWASLDQARYQSQQLVSASNVKGMLVACKIYANEHKHQWPPNLKVLVVDGSITPNVLQSPYPDRLPNGSGSFYLYRRIGDESTIKNASQEVVISEPGIHGGGAVFGFVDGHSEWIASPRADELLAIMRAGR